MSNLANFKTPSVSNEPNKHYAKDSIDRAGLASAISAFAKKAPLEIPLVIGGKSVSSPCFPNLSPFSWELAEYEIASCRID
jgi:1-pyrroline-5-carboxylate dehydrogenase